jgi:uncharacterized protein YdaU (DUF1376 family)
VSKAPAFQFYPKQWLGDDNVLLMSFEARGMHMHLMCIAWQQEPPCTLPADDEMLRQWVGNPRNWEKLKAQILRAWRMVDGRWLQAGLLAEYNKQKAYSESRKSSADKRWNKDAYEMHTHSVRNALQSSSSTSDIKPPIVPQGGPVAVPDSKPKKTKATMTAEQREWFTPWWESYPRKDAKQPAEIAWGRIVRDKATAEAALVGLKAQLPDLLARERDKIPHPATWINQMRWTDEIRAPTVYPVRDVPPTRPLNEVFLR